MAGDWIKMRVNLAADPQVINVARLLDCSEFKVVGLLHWLWSWADAHTEDGRAVGIDCKWINKQTDTEGFCQALVRVGWLHMEDDWIQIPNFDSHNGASAKSRANGARRAATFKARKAQTPVVNEPKEPVRTKKVRKTYGKVDALMLLLEGDYKHLMEGDKAKPVSTWVAHLAEMLNKPYTERGAHTLLKKMDDMPSDELAAAVDFSLQNNYQGLFPAKKQYGQGQSNKPKFEEYDD